MSAGNAEIYVLLPETKPAERSAGKQDSRTQQTKRRWLWNCGHIRTRGPGSTVLGADKSPRVLHCVGLDHQPGSRNTRRDLVSRIVVKANHRAVKQGATIDCVGIVEATERFRAYINQKTAEAGHRIALVHIGSMVSELVNEIQAIDAP